MADTFGFVEALAPTPVGQSRTRQAVVTAVAADRQSVTVTIAGDTTAIEGVRFIESYSPNVNDTVWIVTDGKDLFITGALAVIPSGGSVATHAPLAMSIGRETASFSSSTSASGTITFPVGRFTHPPAITGNVITTASASIGSVLRFSNINKDTAGFTLTVTTSGTFNIAFNWIAVQMTNVSIATTSPQ